MNQPLARQAVEAVLRFLGEKAFAGRWQGPGRPPGSAMRSIWHNVLTTAGGLLVHRLALGEQARAGDVLAEVVDPFTGAVEEQLHTQVEGRVFFIHRSQLINGHEVAYRVLPGGINPLTANRPGLLCSKGVRP